MKKYIIYSKESKYCKNDINTLDAYPTCLKCNCLSIPSLRTYKEPERIFCKSCFPFLDMNIEDLAIYSKPDVFTLNSIEVLTLHQQNCQKTVIPIKKCVQCTSDLFKDTFQRKSNQLQDTINSQQTETIQLRQNVQNQNKENDISISKIIDTINILQKTIKSHSTNLNILNKTVQNNKKFINFMAFILFSASLLCIFREDKWTRKFR